MPQAAAQLPLPSHVLFGLLLHLEKILLELGRGFAFVGRQYRIEVSDREFMYVTAKTSNRTES